MRKRSRAKISAGSSTPAASLWPTVGPSRRVHGACDSNSGYGLFSSLPSPHFLTPADVGDVRGDRPGVSLCTIVKTLGITRVTQGITRVTPGSIRVTPGIIRVTPGITRVYEARPGWSTRHIGLIVEITEAASCGLIDFDLSPVENPAACSEKQMFGSFGGNRAVAPRTNY